MARALSLVRARELAARPGDMAAPMLGSQMVGDPYIGRAKDDAKALLDRRACQYATVLAERQGLLRHRPEEYNARHLGGGRVVFESFLAEKAHDFEVMIPAHIMEFDPNEPARQLT
jgi:hypothetical protein